MEEIGWRSLRFDEHGQCDQYRLIGSKEQQALPAPPFLQSLRIKDDHVFLDSEVGCALEAPEGPLPAAFQPVLWGEENTCGLHAAGPGVKSWP